MRSGALRHKIIIEEPIESKGSMGGTSKNWVRFHECMAEVRELSGKEQLQDGQIQSKITAKAFIRYKSGINSSMRIVNGDNVYQVDAVINADGKKIMQELLLFEFR